MNNDQIKKSRSIKTYFLTGILVSAPISITLYLAVELIRWIDSTVTAVIPEKYNPETYLPYGIPGFGILFLFVLLIFIGMISSGFIGNALLSLMNKIISKMPLVSTVYGALRKIIETIMGEGQAKAFRQAVLVQYPREGLWTIAFITGDVYSDIQKEVKKNLISIYVPTTPNPTSGFLIFVPQKDIIPLQIGVDDAWKIIISTGIITPDSPENQRAIMDEAIENAKKEISNPSKDS